MSRTTRRLDDQYWRSPIKSLRASAKVRLFTGVSWRTTTATSLAAHARTTLSRETAANRRVRIGSRLRMSESKARLEESAVHPRLARPTLIAVLELESRETRYVVAHTHNRPRQTGDTCKNGIGLGDMNVFEPVI